MEKFKKGLKAWWDSMGKFKKGLKAWRDLATELWARTVEPLGHPPYVIYFLVSVVVAGGAGIWLELCTYLIAATQDPQPPLAQLKTSLITFFPAVACSACLQMIWAENDRKDLRAFATLVLFVMSILALMTGLIAVIPICTAVEIGIYSSVFSLWVWWIANARQKDLLGTVFGDDATGGKNVNIPLAGNLAGFKT